MGYPYDLIVELEGELRVIAIQAMNVDDAWRQARQRYSEQVRAVVFSGDCDLTVLPDTFSFK
tara:strand:- start:392 stop:577 length:186 start_codon:yes stop_codon:yes gene_type:complete